MSGHIIGGPTPNNSADSQWYTTNSEYGRTVNASKRTTAGLATTNPPSYKARPFYIAPNAGLKLPVAGQIQKANGSPSALANERRVEADARKHLTTGPAQQFMQGQMGRFWGNILQTTDASDSSSATANGGKDVSAATGTPEGAGEEVEAASETPQQQDKTNRDVLTITPDGEGGDGGEPEFTTRADDDAISHSIPSTASSGNGTVASPVEQAKCATQAKT